jgi:integrase
MKGYVTQKGTRWYAVVYEGLDPVTGREQRRWHAAGTCRADAERLAARLAKERNGRNDEARSLTFGAYLTRRWLPGKKVNLAPSTYDSYRRKIERHIVPTLGRTSIRRLRVEQLETLYDSMLHPIDGRRPLAPKTVLEVHLIIRGALADAVTKGVVNRNVALVAHAPRLRSIPKVEPQTWTAQQLQAFLTEAAGHRLFPALWVLAATGMRRSELLGLKWTDIDLDRAAIKLNRGLVSVGYELHQSRGKTATARRRIELDPTTIEVLRAWQHWQQAERTAIGAIVPEWVFTDSSGRPVHPDKLSHTFDRLVRRSDVPIIRLHDLRHTHATLLIDAGVPVKVVSERLGHATATFTIETYQHVLPSMQTRAVDAVTTLMTPVEARRLKNRKKPA